MWIVVTFSKFEPDNSSTKSVNAGVNGKAIGLEFVVSIRGLTI